MSRRQLIDDDSWAPLWPLVEAAKLKSTRICVLRRRREKSKGRAEGRQPQEEKASSFSLANCCLANTSLE